MADAQPEENVEVRLGFVQHQGLGDGVAHRLEAADPDLLVVLHSDGFLRDATHLATHGDHIEPLPLQKVGEEGRLVHHAAAEGHPETFKPETPGELDELFEA